MSQWTDPKLWISLILIGLFAFAFADNPDDETMRGALILAFATAYGFWLGSNKGETQKTENTGAAFRAIEATAKATGTPNPADTIQDGDQVTVRKDP